MEKNLAQQAIEAALKGDWKSAVEKNKAILKKESQNIDALNRLARAYAELGEITRAKQFSAKVIKLDPFNSIAAKCLEKWQGLKKGDTIRYNSSCASAFLEEPGKTKIITLMDLGASKALVKLDSADEVKLNPHGHRLSVISIDGKYLGRLPDDIAARLKKLIGMGNVYKILIKSIEPKEVKVFIREIKCSPKTVHIQSFPTDKMNYVSYTPPELVHKKEDMDLPTTLEIEDEFI